MGWLKEFESEEDFLDALWDAHQDGQCREFLKGGECTYCILESDRQKWEDKKGKGGKMNLSELDCLEVWMSIGDAMKKLTILSISEMAHHAFDDHYIYCLPTCNASDILSN